jgi:hypothetical protein
MILPPVPVTPSAISPTRTLIVGLALIPLTLVVIASIPALAILPFTANGLRYIEMLIGRVASCSISIVRQSGFHPREVHGGRDLT